MNSTDDFVFIVILVILVAVAFGSFGHHYGYEQGLKDGESIRRPVRTSSPNSPVINGNSGSVMYNCDASGQEGQ